LKISLCLILQHTALLNLKKAGLDPSKYGLHSPRSGATTEAFKLGVDHHVIDLKGRWKCKLSKYQYVKYSDKELVRKSKLVKKY
jgi:hypothetical protein